MITTDSVVSEAFSEFKEFVLAEYPFQVNRMEIAPHPAQAGEKSDLDVLVFVDHWSPQINQEVDDLACDLLLQRGVLFSPFLIDRESVACIED